MSQPRVHSLSLPDEWDEHFRLNKLWIDSNKLPGSQGPLNISAYSPCEEEHWGSSISYQSPRPIWKPNGPEQRVTVEISFERFWAQSRSGPASKFFDSKKRPRVGVLVFFALESGQKHERRQALRLMRKEGDMGQRFSSKQFKDAADDEEIFNEIVGRWLLHRTKEDAGLKSMAAEEEIARKRYRDPNQPNSRRWSSGQIGKEFEERFDVSERCFLRSLRRASIEVGGIPSLSEIRTAYRSLTDRLISMDEDAQRRKNSERRTEVKSLSALQSVKPIKGKEYTDFDKIVRRLGFSWLPKEKEIKKLGENIQFCRTR